MSPRQTRSQTRDADLLERVNKRRTRFRKRLDKLRAKHAAVIAAIDGTNGRMMTRSLSDDRFDDALENLGKDLFNHMIVDVDKKKEKYNLRSVFKVLEIGPGDSVDDWKAIDNILPDGVRLTLLDLKPMDAAAFRTKYDHIRIEECITGNAEDMTCFTDASFDAVVVCAVLCCVRDKDAAVREIHRILKPDGKLYYMMAERTDVVREYCCCNPVAAIESLSKNGFCVNDIQERPHPDLEFQNFRVTAGIAVKLQD